MAMEPLVRLHKSWYKIRRPLALAATSFLWIATLQVPAVTEDDVLQLAVNYVFTGRIDPPDHPEIVDRKSCIVVVFEPKFQAYIRYYLNRFRLEPISKSLEEDNEAGELDKAEEVLGMVLPADEDATLPLYPSEETLDEPPSHITA